MDARTLGLREESTTLNATLKSLRTTYNALASTLSTADLRESVTNMEFEKAEILKRLASLRSGKIQPVSKEEKGKIDKDLKMWEKIAAARKCIAEEMWKQASDTVSGKAEIAALKVSTAIQV
jgi:26S proteasome regulatory subunit (ATPase 3-interacting protein)